MSRRYLAGFAWEYRLDNRINLSTLQTCLCT